MNTQSKLMRVLVLALLAGASALWLRASAADPGTEGATALEQINLMVDVRHMIVAEYVEQPDTQKMTDAAVRGMVASLDDPYTVYLSPEEMAPFDKQVRGTFVGIGAEVEVRDNHLRIVTPLDDSPAWKAGVLAGDVVLEIDGKSAEGLSVNAAINLLRGEVGTLVTLRVRHPSGAEAVIPITRGQINVQTVRGVRRGPNEHWDFILDPVHQIGYIRITQFTENTGDELKAALAQLTDHHMRGLILDLRFDPGGLLESAVAVCNMFLPPGQRIVSLRGRVVPETVYTSAGEGLIAPVPMVVLANESSASAAEIVTGALSDNHRARFVGTRTFGKGSVQQVRALENGEGALKITNAYYYLPNGRNIHRRKNKAVWGVDPDEGCYVPMTFEQVEAMVKLRSAGDVLGPVGAATQPAVTPDSIRRDLKDPQLAAALRAVLGKLGDDRWPVVGLSHAQALAIETERDGLQRQRDALTERLAQVDDQLNKLDHPATQPGPGAAATRMAQTVPTTIPASQP